MSGQNGQRRRKRGEAYDGVGRLSLRALSDRTFSRDDVSGRVECPRPRGVVDNATVAIRFLASNAAARARD